MERFCRASTPVSNLGHVESGLQSATAAGNHFNSFQWDPQNHLVNLQQQQLPGPSQQQHQQPDFQFHMGHQPLVSLQPGFHMPWPQQTLVDSNSQCQGPIYHHHHHVPLLYQQQQQPNKQPPLPQKRKSVELFPRLTKKKQPQDGTYGVDIAWERDIWITDNIVASLEQCNDIVFNIYATEIDPVSGLENYVEVPSYLIGALALSLKFGECPEELDQVAVTKQCLKAVRIAGLDRCSCRPEEYQHQQIKCEQNSERTRSKLANSNQVLHIHSVENLQTDQDDKQQPQEQELEVVDEGGRLVTFNGRLLNILYDFVRTHKMIMYCYDKKTQYCVYTASK